MNRVSIREQVFNGIVMLLIQLPLLYKVTLFDRAFGFFYVGFLLLLPTSVGTPYLMIIGFFSGLLVDVFSNTPGIHAAACVLIMLLRNGWLRLVSEDALRLRNLNVLSLKKVGFAAYVFPLVFIHHILIFVVENGGFHLFVPLLGKIFFSSIFSFILIFTLNYLIAPKRMRS